MLTLIVIMMMGLLSQHEGHHELKDYQVESLKYYKSGNTKLLGQQPWYGLADLQVASTLLDDQSDPSSALLGFFISFSQIVACDVLGLHDQTIQAMDSFVQSFQTVGLALEGGDRSNKSPVSKPFADTHRGDLEFLQKLASFTSSTSLKQAADSFSLATEKNYREHVTAVSKLVRNKLEQDVQYLAKLAYLAPTSEVQRLLFLLVEACSGIPEYYEESLSKAA